MIDIKCTCGEIYHADEKYIGQKIQCGSCGSIIIIQIPPEQKKTEYYRPNPQTSNIPKTPPKKHKFNIKQFIPLFVLILFVLIAASLFYYVPSSPAKNTKDNRPQTGNIYSDSVIPPQNEHDIIQPSANPNLQNSEGISNKPPADPYADWDRVDLRTGKSPGCFNYTPVYDYSIDNKLTVTVGSNTDVVLKLCNYQNGKCIRYIYIRSGNTFNITHIPQGKYYTKIAYGHDWRQKIIDGQCIGKFSKNALYKKGDQVLNFFVQHTGNTIEGDYEYENYNIPSFSLTLDVVTTDFDTNIYHTGSISEDEFNK